MQPDDHNRMMAYVCRTLPEFGFNSRINWWAIGYAYRSKIDL